MAGPTYRSGGEEEPVREAHARALLPATRERIGEACERGEALASAQPRWAGRPARWLLAMGAVVSGLLGPLAFSFGRIDEHPFASRPVEHAALLVACVAGLALGGLLLRSLALRRGGLPPGVYLFSSGLLEIRGGRVRVWPLDRLRQIEQRGAVARLHLGPAGWLRLTTGEEDLVGMLERTRERLAQATDEHDETTLDQLDPCHHERGRPSFRRLTRPARLAAVEARPRRQAIGAALVALAALLGGHTVATQVRRWSDSLGIDLARRQHDLTSLHSYLWQGGPLADDADRSWVELLDDATDESLQKYIALPYARRAAHVDDVLVERLLRRNVADHLRMLGPRFNLWGERVQSNPQREEEARRRVAAAADDLRHYLATGRPGQPLRPQVEQRLFELTLARDSVIGCESFEEPLEPYLERTDERGEQARSARWSRELRNAARCEDLTRFDAARSMARTAEQRAAVARSWAALFAENRTRARRLADWASTECARPGVRALVSTLGAWRSDLWEYLGAHPDIAYRVLGSGARLALIAPRASADEPTDWEPAQFSDDVLLSHATGDNPCTALLYQSEQTTDLRDLLTTPEGPHLQYRKVGWPLANGQEVVELTLRLPGHAVRRARFAVP